MTLVYAGTCCHAPGMTSRAEMAAPETRKQLHDAFARQRQALVDTGTEALVMVSSEHFANFFMDNICLLYTSPSPRDVEESRMPSSA